MTTQHTPRTTHTLLLLALVCASFLTLQACASASYDRAYASKGEGSRAYEGKNVPQSEMSLEPALNKDPSLAGLVSADSDGELDESFDYASNSPTNSAPTPEAKPAKPAGSSSDPAQSAPSTTKRLIIYTADMHVAVFEVEDTITKAKTHVSAAQGWVQQSTTTSLTIRVPVQNFQSLVDQLAELGDIQHKNIVGTDVSEEFFDLQIRLRNAEALRARFAELLKQAKTVEDSLKIEKELARITDKIERMKGRIKFLSDRGTFSTITIHFSKKANRPTHNKHTPLPFYWLRNYSIGNVF